MTAMRFAIVLLAACHTATTVVPGAPHSLAACAVIALDTTPKERRRMVAPEVYLRAYLAWFGGLVPLDVQLRAKPKGLFDAWDDYLAGLGLPDYKMDLPRQTQSNTLMLATLGRLGEALCVRAVEHDLHGKTPPKREDRVVFAFETSAKPTADDFAIGFDLLHRTFLGYPAKLAPPDRTRRFYALFTQIAERHGDAAASGGKAPLTAEETAWAAVCTALVQHPEAELY